MSGRYQPVPTAQEAAVVAERQMEDAFDVSDDEETAQETQPMIHHPPSGAPAAPATPLDTSLYNFEIDYTMPPPGSPPRPSAMAIPNNVFGNSNGQLPDFAAIPPPPSTSWLRRNIGSLLPPSLGGGPAQQPRAVGGNDGVFANVTAKPTITVTNQLSRAEEGASGSAHVVPEFEQKDAPPTYADAQQDAVPPYWDTTVLAPGGSGDEFMVEGFPPGHVFSFITSLFISFSFQFIGFMLTTLLASTHAAKFGSRAGLGMTLVQYGFYLRSNVRERMALETDLNGWPVGAQPHPTFATPKEADDYYASQAASTPTSTPSVPSMGNGDYMLPNEVSMATDWLSFFLMTIGWLLFLTSILGYWRVKRWERSLRPTVQAVPSANEFTGPYVGTVRAGVARDFRRLFSRLPQSEPEAVEQEEHDTISRSESERQAIERTLAQMDPETRRRHEAALQIDRQIEHNLRRSGLL